VTAPHAHDEATFLDEDGLLRIVTWARRVARSSTPTADALVVRHDRELEHPMHGAPATGRGLVTNGRLGADLIRLPAGKGFAPHTHPGDHLLLQLAGRGTICYGGKVYETVPGTIYMVEGSEPHAVGAIDDAVILAVGSPHRRVESPDRMDLVEYRAVLCDAGDLECLICMKDARHPFVLHDLDCPHCPCPTCVPSS